MAKKEVDWTIVVAGAIGVLQGAMMLGYLPEIVGGYEVAGSLVASAAIMGLILLATRANLT